MTRKIRTAKKIRMVQNRPYLKKAERPDLQNVEMIGCSGMSISAPMTSRKLDHHLVVLVVARNVLLEEVLLEDVLEEAVVVEADVNPQVRGKSLFTNQMWMKMLSPGVPWNLHSQTSVQLPVHRRPTSVAPRLNSPWMSVPLLLKMSPR